MEKLGEMNLYSFDDLLNEEVGMVGTANCELFEAKVNEKVRTAKTKSYHLTMPTELYATISTRANDLGESISSYISEVLYREISVAM